MVHPKWVHLAWILIELLARPRRFSLDATKSESICTTSRVLPNYTKATKRGCGRRHISSLLYTADMMATRCWPVCARTVLSWRSQMSNMSPEYALLTLVLNDDSDEIRSFMSSQASIARHKQFREWLLFSPERSERCPLTAFNLNLCCITPPNGHGELTAQRYELCYKYSCSQYWLRPQTRDCNENKNF